MHTLALEHHVVSSGSGFQASGLHDNQDSGFRPILNPTALNSSILGVGIQALKFKQLAEALVPIVTQPPLQSPLNSHFSVSSHGIPTELPPNSHQTPTKLPLNSHQIPTFRECLWLSTTDSSGERNAALFFARLLLKFFVSAGWL